MIQVFTSIKENDTGYDLIHNYFVNAMRCAQIDACYHLDTKDKTVADLTNIGFALRDIIESDKWLGKTPVVRERKVKPIFNKNTNEIDEISYYTGNVVCKTFDDKDYIRHAAIYTDNNDLLYKIRLGFYTDYQKYIERINSLAYYNSIVMISGNISQMNQTAIDYLKRVYSL